MHTQATPRWMFALLGLNFAATLMLPLLLLPVDHAPEWRELWPAIAYPVVYGNSIGIPSVLLMPRLVAWFARRGAPLIPVVIGLSIGMTAFGSVIGAAILVWTGILPPDRWIQSAFQTFRVAAILAVIFGLGSFFYALLHGELRSTAARLHEKELAEAHAQRLAAEARLDSLESRLRPHFLFNTLNSISSLIPVDPRRAEEMVGRLAGILRFSLDASSHALIPLEQELRVVEDYVDIEQARLGDKLNGRIDVDPELRHARVPPFSIQPLVENAVKHGIAAQYGGGDFRVKVSASNGDLLIEVSDSGPGFDLQQLRAGHALDNLVARLHALFGEKAHLSVLRRDGRQLVEMVLPRV